MLELIAAAQILACLPAAQMTEALAQRYGEKPIAHRVVAPKAAQILYAAPTGTWTVVITSAGNEMVCIVQSGRSADVAAEIAARGGKL